MTGMNYILRESDITDLVVAESRIEALKALTLLLLREVESLKKIIGPKRPRGKNGGINLADELKTIEASLIKDALIRADGNQRGCIADNQPRSHPSSSTQPRIISQFLLCQMAANNCRNETHYSARTNQTGYGHTRNRRVGLVWAGRTVGDLRRLSRWR